MEKFEKLGLCEHVLKVISDKKFEKPSEIQEKTIPLILEGKDVIAGSATGSGKTLAFGSGIIKYAKKGEGVKALILTPTRELAEQVACAMEEFSYHKGLDVLSIYGGVSMENQIKRLAYADIVVATPGRLLDHMRNNSIDLSKVKFLVLDEADRMWDMGFKEDVGKIVQACPKDRQTLLFSATISGDLADFSGKHMKKPVEISVDNYVDASKLKQIYYDVRDDEKFSLLVHLLKNETAHLVMIFCNTRRNADIVEKNLKLNGVDAQVIHGGLTQARRNQVLKKFDNSTVNVLVCTDVAARGLDIQGVSHVYNYDIASDAKDYIHRIGRTARAGAEGIAINILASRDYDNFSNVQRHNQGLVVDRVDTPRFEKIFIKIERRPQRSGFGRGPTRGGNRPGRGGPVRDNRRSSSSRPVRGKPDSRGRQQRGERNKRSTSGFRGGGRNTQARRNRH
jgi:ATP-dependent RNA helicase DeaD